ncbi:MAG: TlpA disulfide reductase family protein [Rhodoferax sp.]|nr:TlpA disulfide reductase family protein [Rhodoferax sp.]
MPPHLPTPTTALRRMALAMLLSATALGVGHAQTTTATMDAPAAGLGMVGGSLSLETADSKGKRITAGAVRGKVAVVFFWSTRCAVCRDSLPELRANAAGWQNKPFTLLAVNLDSRKDDWLTYEKLVDQTVMPNANWLSVRLDGAAPAAQRLPLTLLVDAKGKVIARYEGRLAPEVWDGVADLLH